MRLEIGRELRLLAAAAQFLTRLPVPEVAYRADWLPRAAKYFPVVGLLVGAIAAAALTAGRALWPAPVPEILAVAAALLVTGAMHEDGLADTADSFGGRTRETRLAIMKDPHLGTFGVSALGVSLALRVAVLASMAAPLAPLALIAGHALARFAALATMAAQTYAGDRGAAKVEHAWDRPHAGEIATGLCLALLPLALLPAREALLGLALGVLCAAVVLVKACRALGGYTGDVLGAGIAVAETAFLLGVAAAPHLP